MVDGADPQVPIGSFAADDSSVTRLDVTNDSGSPFLVVEQDGTRGWLFRDRRGRFTTDHPGLRDFHLVPGPDGSWNHGPHTYGGPAPASGPTPPGWARLVGRYRSFSPWYRTIRVYLRQGRLFLSSPGGVEAPLDEEELVEVQRGVFRIGREEWLPERLHAGPEVDGRCVYVVRDGCHYSRTFLP